MKELIEAFTIFDKYDKYIDEKNKQCPIGCSLGLLYVYIHPKNISNEDKTRLYDLGFSTDVDRFVSIAGIIVK